MGISMLQSFMKTNKAGFELISIPEIVQKYKNETGEDPVMVVDIMSCILHLTPYNNRNPAIGIKLLVISNGIKPYDKQEAWFSFSKEYVHALRQFYSKGEIVNEVYWFKFDFMLLLTSAIHIFHTTDKCESRRANFDSKDYILDYVNKFKTFAILTEDSDFIVAEGARYCISVKHLNLNSMTTYNYNKNHLATFLGITIPQLPLFGVLCSEALNIPKLKSNWNKFFEVAKWLKKFSSEVEKPEFFDKYVGANSATSRVIQEKLKRYYGDGKIAINYTKNENWDSILNLAERRHALDISHKDILEILVERQLHFSVLWTNFLKPDAVSALKPLRKKIYGLLFHEYPKTEEVFITEYNFKISDCNGTVMECADSIKVEFSPYPHPGLRKLWLENISEEIKREKQNLFCQVLNEKLNYKDIKSNDISEDLIFPVLATFYLLYELKKKLKSFEITTLLMQAVLTKHLTANEVDSYDDQCERDSLDLSDWFIRVISHLRLLNNVCGEPFCVNETNLINYFDLKLLHIVYQKAKKQCLDPTMWSPTIWLQYEALRKKLFELGAKCG